MKNESSPKKLLIIVNALSMGGAEHMIYELVKFIDRDKFSPTILCYGKHQENPLESKVSQVCDVKYVGITRKIGIAEMRKVFSLIKEISPDIIHAHQGGVSFAVPWCALHRTPLCITVHSNPHKAFSKNNNCMIKLFKKTLNLMLVAVSKENLSLVQEYYKLDDKKSIYINNGIDIHRFYKNKENDKFTFINVARQDENKNQSAILRATFMKVNLSFSLFL